MRSHFALLFLLYNLVSIIRLREIGIFMTYVIAEPCIGTKDTACVMPAR